MGHRCRECSPLRDESFDCARVRTARTFDVEATRKRRPVETCRTLVENPAFSRILTLDCPHRIDSRAHARRLAGHSSESGGPLSFQTTVITAVVAASSLFATGAAPARKSSQSDGLRQVVSGEPGLTTDVSADGRFAVLQTQPFVATTERDPSRLIIRDLAGPTAETIVEGPGPFGRPAAVFSDDGAHIAFGWIEAQPPGGERASARTVLNIVAARRGATPRTVVGPIPDGGGPVPHAWSADGKAILVLVHGPGDRIPTDPTSIGWVSVADGTGRTIKTLEPWRRGASSRLRLSPDGTAIAYAAVPQQGSTESHIYVIDADGANERSVMGVPGSSSLPVWTPDGRHILFVNNQAGRRNLFAVPVQPQGTLGQATLVKPDFIGDPVRIARTGTLYSVQPDFIGWYQLLAERHAFGMRITESFQGVSGTFSPTGNDLAFLRTSPQRTDLVIRSLDSGRERIFRYAGIGNTPPRWLRGGKALIVHIMPAGDDGQPGGSFYRVDVETGGFTRMFAKDAADGVRSNASVLSPDNRTLYLPMRAHAKAPWTGIVKVDLETGVESGMLTLPTPGLEGNIGVAMNPDGNMLAIHTHDGRILTMRADGGDYRQLSGPWPGGGGWPDLMRWTPDGRFIVFPAENGEKSGWHLLKIASAGGEPELEGLDSSKFVSAAPLPRLQPRSLFNLDLSVNGRRLAFSLRALPAYDVWALDNVTGSLRR